MRLPILYKILIVNSFIVLLSAILGIGITERVVEEGRFTLLTYAAIVLVTIGGGAILNYLVLKIAFRPLGDLQAVVRQVHAGNLRARAILDRAMDPDITHFATALNAMLERMEANARTIAENERRLQLLAAQVITAQEEERKRVARELHDEASQALTTLIIGLESALADIPPRLSGLRRRLAGLIALAESTLEEIRNLALSLRPTILDDLGLPAAVRWYAKNIGEKAGLTVRLEMVNMEERLPASVETAVFRIVQEGLTNIVKHAAAREALVCLKRADGHVSILIADDGQGFDTTRLLTSRSQRNGLGLFGIEERVTLLRGTWQLHSEPGKGTQLQVSIPLEVEASREDSGPPS